MLYYKHLNMIIIISVNGGDGETRIFYTSLPIEIDELTYWYELASIYMIEVVDVENTRRNKLETKRTKVSLVEIQLTMNKSGI